MLHPRLPKDLVITDLPTTREQLVAFLDLLGDLPTWRDTAINAVVSSRYNESLRRCSTDSNPNTFFRNFEELPDIPHMTAAQVTALLRSTIYKRR